MNQGVWLGRSLGSLLCLGVSSLGGGAIAQITPDGTLGTAAAGDLLGGCSGAGLCTITNGTPAGSNLFHSFSEFSLSGGEARFEVAPSIESIFTRVTGGSVSNLDGLLSVPGSTADLFFMNPAGITFGPNANINLRGSFTATTVDSIEFGTTGVFDLSTNLAEAGLLTVTPSAFLFNQIPQPIAVEAGAQLQAGDGNEPKILRLLGGPLTINGGTLRAPAGNIRLAAIAAPARLDVTVPDPGDRNDRLGLGLEISDDVLRANILIGQDSIVDVVAGGGGDIRLFANDIIISGTDTNLCAGIGSSGSACGSPGAFTGGAGNRDSGNIGLNSTGNIEISQARIENNINPGASGNDRDIFSALDSGELFGSILISGQSFSLLEGGNLSTTSFGEGSAGVINISIDNAATINRGSLFSDVQAGAVGNAGGIFITSANLNILDSRTISSNAFGVGKAGRIFFNVEGETFLSNSRILTNLEEGGVGEVEGIFIESGSLRLENQSVLTSSTFGEIRFNADDPLEGGVISITTDKGSTLLTGESLIATLSGSSAVGDGGSVLIKGPDLVLTEGSRITTSTLGRGNAGLFSADVSGDITLDGKSYISATVSGSNAIGDGGGILIESSNLSLSGKSYIVTSTSGQGNAGLISANTSGEITLNDGSYISSNSFSQAIGNAGFVDLEAENIEVRNNSFIDTTAFGVGEAGYVEISAKEDIILEQEGKIFSNSQENATSGGFIFIEADRLIAKDGSGVTSSSFVEGRSTGRSSNRSSSRFDDELAQRGGGVFILARRVVLDDESFIAALSTQGEAGLIGIVTDEYTVLSDQSFITTTSFAGLNSFDDLGPSFLDNTEPLPKAGGGTVIVITEFLAGTPRRNSDVLATARDRKGGDVLVDAFSLISIAERPLSDSSNDISAESGAGINGTVSINALDIDPSRSLDDLPEARLPDLLAEGCRPTGRPVPKDKFYATGLGGLPPNPSDILRGSTVLADLEGDTEPAVATASPDSSPENSLIDNNLPPEIDPAAPLKFARGWVRDENGDVFFSASAPNLSAQTGPKPYNTCSAAS